MKKLILIRHGETSVNTRGKLHRLNDIEPLTEVGREQIRKTAEILKGYSIKKLYASQEKRAVESATLIAEILSIPVDFIFNLHERDWGDFSGKEWSEVQAILDKLSLDERYIYEPPNGESWKFAEERLIRTLTNIIDTTEGHVAIVTHGGSIRILMPYLLNVPKEESFKYNPENASLTIFEYDNGVFKKVTIDDTSHLT